MGRHVTEERGGERETGRREWCVALQAPYGLLGYASQNPGTRAGSDDPRITDGGRSLRVVRSQAGAWERVRLVFGRAMRAHLLVPLSGDAWWAQPTLRELGMVGRRERAGSHPTKLVRNKKVARSEEYSRRATL